MLNSGQNILFLTEKVEWHKVNLERFIFRQKESMSKTKNKRKRKLSRSTRPKNRAVQTTEKFIKSGHDVCTEMATVRIKREAFYALMHQLGTKPAERGGIILGPVGTNDITHFYFDRDGGCTGSSYSPDYITLNRKMREQWLPAGLDMKGFVHSHPGNLDSLTAGDMSYIKKLLSKNPDMNMFIAPIVLPHQYRIQPLIISRDRMDYVQRAHFEFF